MEEKFEDEDNKGARQSVNDCAIRSRATPVPPLYELRMASNNQARAKAQYVFTVDRERSRAWATSSLVMPPKYRSFTTWAWTGCCRSSFSRASFTARS